MKIKELIAELSKLDPESQIFLQRDPEGNNYSPAAGIDGDCIWDGEEIYHGDWSAKDAAMEEVKWKKLKKRKRCAVLYPKY